jgi:Tol biopolymer transport system component
MSLPAQTRVGPYEIISLLGAGGMGEVYRARDTRPSLDREVAIKVLPSSFSSDPERLRRFEQEARAAGMLNHPNIVAIYDVGTHEGAPYVVTELLEGETVRSRMAGGALPQRKAIEYALQTARGLAAAHEKGIVHRDLKPGNLFITKDARVKILDFGLAKLARGTGISACAPGAQAGMPVPPGDETEVAGTQPGAVLGTVGYMSPEQVRGKATDLRSDIFSFGAILYEMLAGHRAFQRDTAAETMTAILKDDPPELPATTQIPPALERLVRHCLEKNPEERFRSAHDLAFALENVSGVSSSTLAAAGVAPRPLLRRLSLAWALVALLSVALAVGAGLWLRSGRGASPGWTGARLGGPEYAYGPRISPDGETLAFTAIIDRQSQVAIMKPDSGNWNVLTKERHRGYAHNLSWSRDGSRIYFDRFLGGLGAIYSVSAVGGGPERLILEDAVGPESLPDGSLLVARRNAARELQLYRYWPETGRTQELPAQVSQVFVRAWPDGREALFYGKALDQPNAQAPAHLYALDLVSPRTRRLAPRLAGYSIHEVAFAAHPQGRSAIVTLIAGNLFTIEAVPRDGGSLLQPLLTLTNYPYFLDAAPDGSLYADEFERPSEILRFETSGKNAERVAIGNVRRELREQAAQLPDGRVLFPSQVSGRTRLLVTEPKANPISFAETGEETWAPIALLDQRQVAFLLGPAGDRCIAIASIADGRIVRRLQGGKGADIQGLACSPDAKTVYYTAGGGVWAVPATDGTPRKVGEGDWVAVDPRQGDLIVLFGENMPRLMRLPASGGAPQEIPFKSELHLSRGALAYNAVGPDGRILVVVFSDDDWFRGPAVLDSRTGRVEQVPLTYPVDFRSPGWTPDGRIVSMGSTLRAALWRFRPVK